jgi:hypothetical protein
MLLNWTDILDGAIANAAWGVVIMVAGPRTGRRAAADLDTAAGADNERLIKDTLAEIDAGQEAFRQACRLAELPMPAQFRRMFRDWEAGRVEFTGISGR